MQSLPITANVMSPNATQTRCTRYSIKRYSLLVTSGRWLFSPGTPVSSINKTDRHDIIEILLKVALNTLTHNPKVVHTTYMYVYINTHVTRGTVVVLIVW